MRKNEYTILISANCISNLNKNDLNNHLVASLYDIDTEEKISDGDSNKFEILDYNFTNVSQEQSIDKFILSKLKKLLETILNNNGYSFSLLSIDFFDKIVDDKFIITEYEIGKICAYSEIYFQIMQKPNCFSNIIEKILSCNK